jgi:hypothetical protein
LQAQKLANEEAKRQRNANSKAEDQARKAQITSQQSCFCNASTTTMAVSSGRQGQEVGRESYKTSN